MYVLAVGKNLATLYENCLWLFKDCLTNSKNFPTMANK